MRVVPTSMKFMKNRDTVGRLVGKYSLGLLVLTINAITSVYTLGA